MAGMSSRLVLVSAMMLLPVIPNLSAAQGGRAAQIAMRQKQAAELEARPTPRMAGGHPDMSGNWTFQDEVWSFVHPKIDSKGDICFVNCDPAPPRPAAVKTAAGKGNAGGAGPRQNFPDYKVQFQSEVQTLRRNIVGTDPVLHQCQNPGLPRIGPPSYIIQTGTTIAFLYASVNGNYWRVVPLGGAHNADADPSPLGDSIGKWDGDTLVVESVNFTPDTWLTDYGAFHTADLRVVERYTRKGDAILYQVTSYDPTVLTKPWTQDHILTPDHNQLQPSPECIEKDMTKMVNQSYHPNPP